MSKIALLTGISGQDGSYLAELLLHKGYEVHGIVRRSSSQELSLHRIQHILDRITLHEGDITDANFVSFLIRGWHPVEIYNLAAQSHVQTSFAIPDYTFRVNTLGLLNILDAVANDGEDSNWTYKPRIYQASTSEMFGGQGSHVYYNEDSKFNPRSPYAVSKVAAHQLAEIYRNIGIFVACGIMFNHESILKNSPVLLRDYSGWINVLPIEDMFKSEHHRHEGLLDKYIGYDVWNGESFTKILNGSAYKDKTKDIRLVQTRDSCCETTSEHVYFLDDGSEVKSVDLSISDKLFASEFPENYRKSFLYETRFLEFIGFVVGDGHISMDGGIRITGTDDILLELLATNFCSLFGWSYRISTFGPGKFAGCVNNVWQLDINNDSNFGKWLRGEIYTVRSREKRVPRFVLNGSDEVKKAFFDGYYLADGRKAGHERYEYKGFTTKSATLCLGLIYLMNCIRPSQKAKVICNYRNNIRYYYVQFTSPDNTRNGEHLVRCKNEIIKIYNTKSTDGWFYDLQTESKSFATGANLVRVHNSPRRGDNFVTKKIAVAAAKAYLDIPYKLEVGNLDAVRDWGFAPAYVEVMWKMLQQDRPETYVVGTGVSHTVRDLLETASLYVGKPLVYSISNQFIRPLEVDYLQCKPSKISDELGWSAITTFYSLVRIMVDAEIERLMPEKYDADGYRHFKKYYGSIYRWL